MLSRRTMLKTTGSGFGYLAFAALAHEQAARASDAKAPGGGVLEKDGRWRALAAGEFVLGYPDEDSRDDPKRRLPAAPADPLGKSGTYMVWRKLYQDVARWRRVLRDSAKLYEGGDEETPHRTKTTDGGGTTRACSRRS